MATRAGSARRSSREASPSAGRRRSSSAAVAAAPAGKRAALGRAVEPPLVAGDVVRERDPGPQVRARDGLAGDEADRDVAGPDVERGVLALAVVRAAGRDLRRRLGEREREDRGRLELLAARLARLLPASGQHLLGERAQRFELLVRLAHGARVAEHHDRPVVDAHLEHRAREHHPVEQRHGQAHRHRRADGPERAAGRRAVDVDLLADARVERRDDERLAFVGEADVSDERLVEDRLDGVAVVRRLVVHAPQAHALRRRVRAAANRGGAHGAEDRARSGPLSRAIDGAADGTNDVRVATADPQGILVALDHDASEPLRRQLAGALRDAIRAGRLRTGVRLPASRALAEQLGVSRGVVTDAYEQLTAEGWLAARRGAGTTVAAAPAAEPPRSTAPGRAAVRFDFTATAPDVSLFPRRQWARAVARAAADAPDAELDYGSGFGSLALREALAGYLGRVRATAAGPA